ncbi:HU family DNA-binding protein [Alkalihalobacillus sp. NPDC078783]
MATTKKEIAAELREVLATTGLELNKGESQTVVNSVFDIVTAKISQGEKVQVSGLGGFEVNDTKARKGRNPQSGEEIEIAASKRISYKPAKPLKDAVKALV